MIEKQLLQITREFFPSSSIDINEWQSVLEQCKKDISIYHLFSTTEYFVAYYSKNNAINLSIIFYDNKKAVGIMPLITYQNLEQEWVLSSNGVEIVEPIFIQNLPRKVKNRIEVKLHDLILELTRKLKIKQCQFTNMDYFQLSSWYLIWANTATEIFSTHHLLVDLSLPIDQIRLKFRKSFKPLVNKAIREFIVEVHNHPSEKLFEEFRLLHKEVANRVTRPLDSWKIQNIAVQKIQQEFNNDKSFTQKYLEPIRNKILFHYDTGVIEEILRNYTLTEKTIFAEAKSEMTFDLVFTLTDELLINFLMQSIEEKNTESEKWRYFLEKLLEISNILSGLLYDFIIELLGEHLSIEKDKDN